MNSLEERIKMHTIKLKVKDSIYSHIMYLLKNLNQQEIQIIEDKEVKDGKNIKLSIQALFREIKIEPFESISDPIKWQTQQRDEW